MATVPRQITFLALTGLRCTARMGSPRLGSTIDGYRKEDGAMVRSVMNFDHTIEAVHSDAAPWLLPYAARRCILLLLLPDKAKASST